MQCIKHKTRDEARNVRHKIQSQRQAKKHNT